MSRITKADLLKIPAQYCTKKAVKNLPFADPQRVEFIITAAPWQVKNRWILKATLFTAAERKPAFYIFCDRESDRYYTYDVLCTRWTDSLIYNLPEDRRTPMLAIANTDSTEAQKYFGDAKGRLTAYAILSFELKVKDAHREFHMNSRSRNSYDTYYSSQMYLDTVMAEAHETPEYVKKFVLNIALERSRYMYYKRAGGKLQCFCSHCQQEVEIKIPGTAEKGKQLNEIIVKCPHCHSNARLKMAGRATRMTDGEMIQYAERAADGILIHQCTARLQHSKDYKNHAPELEITENIRQMISIGAAYTTKMFGHIYHGFGREPEWRWERIDRYNCYVENDVVCPYGLKKALAGTRYEHSGLPEFAKNAITNSKIYQFSVERYLNEYRGHPALELLAKCGLIRLVVDSCEYCGQHSFVSPFAKTPTAALGVTKHELKVMRAMDVSANELEVLKHLRDKSREAFSDKEVAALREAGINNTWKVERIEEFENPLNVISYLKKAGIEMNRLNDWADYIENARKLGYDITRKEVKYPKDFSKMHDRFAEQVYEKENAKQINIFKELYQKRKQLFEYENSEYLVKLPQTPYELTREGREMHHCVGTYIGRYAESSSIILFIRRKAEPDVPFITAEISPKNFEPVQIQDKYDKRPSEAVMQFWKKYCGMLKQKIHKTKKGEKAA